MFFICAYGDNSKHLRGIPFCTLDRCFKDVSERSLRRFFYRYTDLSKDISVKIALLGGINLNTYTLKECHLYVYWCLLRDISFTIVDPLKVLYLIGISVDKKYCWIFVFQTFWMSQRCLIFGWELVGVSDTVTPSKFLSNIVTKKGGLKGL